MDKKLTICFFGEAKKEDIHTLKWARFFANKGHNVHLISYTQLNDPNVKNITVHLIKKKLPIDIWPFNTLLNMPFTILWVRNLLKEIKPDLIHAHCVTSYGTLAALVGYKPFVLTAWGSDILINPEKNFLTKWATKNALNKADLITSDARHMEDAMEKLGASREKMKIIFFGVDTEKFKPGKKNEAFLEKYDLKDSPVVISLRRLEPIYNIESLISAVPFVLKECPKAKFVIAGGGSEEQKLKDLANSLNVASSVKFIGWLDPNNLVDYLNSSDVYVSTSLSDGGIASSTAEAMSCGLPVVITNSGENEKWVENEKEGFLVPVKSPEILAEKIITLLKNDDLRLKFGEASRKIIEEKNSYYKEMGRMEDDYVLLANKHKNILPERKYQICTKCVMDTTDPDIVFDENGVCNNCRDYKNLEKYLHTFQELEGRIKEIKEAGKGKQYDCIMGLSGGVDSSMVAYWVKKMGLRALAVHVDNGWDSELAVSNIEKLVRKLGIDLSTHVIDWEQFKDLQVSFLKASVANCEIPTDHLLTSVIYETAAKFGIKYIIYGGNIKTEFIMPAAWGYNARDLKHIKAIHKIFGKDKIDKLPTLSIWKMAYYNLVKKIRYFPILNYIDYDKVKSKEFMKTEFGWQDYGGKHYESIFTRFFQGYILPKKFRFDKRKAHLSCLIISGQITREEAVEELKKSPYPDEKMIGQDKEYVAKKLGLTSEEFEKIMNAPVKSYRDYPNNELFIEKLAFVFVWVKKLFVKL